MSGWNGFDGLHQMLSLRIGRFPLSGLLAKKDDIAPLVRSQLPTCFATPKNAGRVFLDLGSYLIRDFLWGKKSHPTIWDQSGFRLLFGFLLQNFRKWFPISFKPRSIFYWLADLVWSYSKTVLDCRWYPSHWLEWGLSRRILVVSRLTMKICFPILTRSIFRINGLFHNQQVQKQFVVASCSNQVLLQGSLRWTKNRALLPSCCSHNKDSASIWNVFLEPISFNQGRITQQNIGAKFIATKPQKRLPGMNSWWISTMIPSLLLNAFTFIVPNNPREGAFCGAFAPRFVNTNRGRRPSVPTAWLQDRCRKRGMFERGQFNGSTLAKDLEIDRYMEGAHSNCFWKDFVQVPLQWDPLWGIQRCELNKINFEGFPCNGEVFGLVVFHNPCSMQAERFFGWHRLLGHQMHWFYFCPPKIDTTWRVWGYQTWGRIL